MACPIWDMELVVEVGDCGASGREGGLAEACVAGFGSGMFTLGSLGEGGRRWGLVVGVALVAVLGLGGCAGSKPLRVEQTGVMEAACGQCLFHLPGKGCDLAVRHGGRAYYVDGVDLDSLGDAHAKDGMCQVIRHAQVTGELRNGRFLVSRFEMIPLEQKP